MQQQEAAKAERDAARRKEEEAKEEAKEKRRAERKAQKDKERGPDYLAQAAGQHRPRLGASSPASQRIPPHAPAAHPASTPHEQVHH